MTGAKEAGLVRAVSGGRRSAGRGRDAGLDKEGAMDANQRNTTVLLRKLALPGLLVTGLLTGVGAVADDSHPPSTQQIEFATRTSDLLLATLFAALTQEFDETTPNNVDKGKLSISLVFNDRNHDMRLVGTLEPLGGKNNLPRDAFERSALALAMTGQPKTEVERVNGQWYYRRSVPLSNFRSECAFCHSNFPAGPTPDWTGALMLRVPIEK